MTSAVLMGVGAAVWLIGELFALKSGEHPTTWYVRMFQQRHWWARLLVIAGITWLAGHFELGWP